MMGNKDKRSKLREKLGLGLSELGNQVNTGDINGFNESAKAYDALLDEARSLGVVTTGYRRDFDLYTGAIEGRMAR